MRAKYTMCFFYKQLAGLLFLWYIVNVMKKLYLSDTDKKIGGVCGGLAEWAEIDSTVVRLTVLILAVISHILPAVVGYVVAWIVIPHKPTVKVHEAV